MTGSSWSPWSFCVDPACPATVASSRNINSSTPNTQASQTADSNARPSPLHCTTPSVTRAFLKLVMLLLPQRVQQSGRKLTMPAGPWHCFSYILACSQVKRLQWSTGKTSFSQACGGYSGHHLIPVLAAPRYPQAQSCLSCSVFHIVLLQAVFNST